MDKGISRREWLKKAATLGAGAAALSLFGRWSGIGRRDAEAKNDLPPTATLTPEQKIASWDFDPNTTTNPFEDAKNAGIELRRGTLCTTFATRASQFNSSEYIARQKTLYAEEEVAAFDKAFTVIYETTCPAKRENHDPAGDAMERLSKNGPTYLEYNSKSLPVPLQIDVSIDLPPAYSPVNKGTKQFVENPLPPHLVSKTRDVRFEFNVDGTVYKCVLTTTYHIEQFDVQGITTFDGQGKESWECHSTVTDADMAVHVEPEPLFQNIERAWNNRGKLETHNL